MPPDATDNAAENNEPFPPLPPPPPPAAPVQESGSPVSPRVLERMRRVAPDMARRYNQRAGQ